MSGKLEGKDHLSRRIVDPESGFDVMWGRSGEPFCRFRASRHIGRRGGGGGVQYFDKVKRALEGGWCKDQFLYSSELHK